MTRKVPGDSPVGTTHDPNSNTTGTSVEPDDRFPPKRREDDADLREEAEKSEKDTHGDRPVNETAARSAEAGQRDAKADRDRIGTPDRADPAGLTGAAPLRTADFDRKDLKDSKS
jgi:hypothetical protein